MENIGVIVIGRNEGPRLKICLESISTSKSTLIYVDSNSSDNSVQIAIDLGATVVQLGSSLPFSAARARNEGFTKLMQIASHAKFVQFVDGDCVLAEDWLKHANKYLKEHASTAVVFGRLSERYPGASIYNRLCDLEWKHKAGPVESSGGIFMVRTKAFKDVGMFNTDLVAGEEPELCFRLRRAGFEIVHRDQLMGWHDAAIFRFLQWWKRTVRSGWAYAAGVDLHGTSPEKFNVREYRSNFFWGLVFPLSIAFLTWTISFLSLILLIAYPYLAFRIFKYRRKVGDPKKHAWLYAIFCVIGKFASVYGQLKFFWDRWRGLRSTLIEYKS